MAAGEGCLWVGAYSHTPLQTHPRTHTSPLVGHQEQVVSKEILMYTPMHSDLVSVPRRDLHPQCFRVEFFFRFMWSARSQEWNGSLHFCTQSCSLATLSGRSHIRANLKAFRVVAAAKRLANALLCAKKPSHTVTAVKGPFL
jgi:hypothetical protein